MRSRPEGAERGGIDLGEGDRLVGGEDLGPQLRKRCVDRVADAQDAPVLGGLSPSIAEQFRDQTGHAVIPSAGHRRGDIGAIEATREPGRRRNGRRLRRSQCRTQEKRRDAGGERPGPSVSPEFCAAGPIVEG